MINTLHLRELIIKPVLKDLVLYSEDAEELILYTYTIQNPKETFLKHNNDKTLGIYLMSPKIYNDLWQNYIYSHMQFLLLLTSNFDCIRMPSEERLIYDLRFATAMTRLFYARIKDPIPSKTEPLAVWQYYNNHFYYANNVT